MVMVENKIIDFENLTCQEYRNVITVLLDEDAYTIDLSRHLTALDLSNGAITNMKFIVQLPKLETLILDNNKISDQNILSFIAEKKTFSNINKKLKKLSLKQNLVSFLIEFNLIFS